MSDHPTRPTTVTPGDSPGEHPDERPPDIPTADDAPEGAAATRVDGGGHPLAAEPRWNPEPEPAPPSRPPSRPPAGAGEPLARGTTIADRYRLEAPIASGGMATVWRATDTVLTRPVAVKVLHAHLAADPEFVARFRREAVAAARLAHPAIVAIYDTSDDPESIIMELVEGHTLREELDKRSFLPPAEAVAIASSICQALEVAHKAGIVHRDVKPANVLLSPGGQLKVADFGIAKAARSTEDDDHHLPDLTAIGRMVGTAKYLAPEQVSGGDIDARTDVYAMGALLYEMVCGRPPFTGDNDLAVATARLHGPPDRPRTVLRTVPPRLDEIIMKALSLDPDRRHPSAAALWADLQSCPLDDDAVAMPPPPPPDATSVGEQPSFARSERSWLVPALLVSLVAVALGLAWVLIGGTEARRDLFDLVDRVRPGGGETSEDDDGGAAPLAFTGATSFDPDGDGSEHEEEAALAFDGDTATAWTTERYNSRDLGGLKDGVGIILSLQEAAALDELVLTSADAGWAAEIYVSSAQGASLADWGTPAATVDGAEPGETTVALDGAEGQHVLVWVTDLGDDGGVVFELQEVAVRST
ncbi:MAG TPA: protein kinase [Acidimicrobiales bacterium]|nr:protein kinase [Acidimicrobiales bacterium]